MVQPPMLPIQNRRDIDSWRFMVAGKVHGDGCAVHRGRTRLSTYNLRVLPFVLLERHFNSQKYKAFHVERKERLKLFLGSTSTRRVLGE